MSAPTCLDCGQPIPTTLDGVPLCEECLRLAVLLAGSGEARVAQLTATDRLAALLASLETLRDQWRETERDSGGTIDDLYECADDLHRVIEGARG